MSTRHMSAALLALLLTTTTSGTQASPAQIRHGRPYAGTPASRFAPARMIEVRPGLWVGSYQCIVDIERGGRDCSSGN
jgi:hypothetical protein